MSEVFLAAHGLAHGLEPMGFRIMDWGGGRGGEGGSSPPSRAG